MIRITDSSKPADLINECIEKFKKILSTSSESEIAEHLLNLEDLFTELTQNNFNISDPFSYSATKDISTTLLIEAAKCGAYQTIPLFCKFSVDPNSKEENALFDNNAALWAVANGNNEFVKSLLTEFDKKIDLKLKSKGSIITNAFNLLLVKGYIDEDKDQRKFQIDCSYTELLDMMIKLDPEAAQTELEIFDPTKRSINLYTSLDLSCIRKDQEAIKLLSNFFKRDVREKSLDFLNLSFSESCKILSTIVGSNFFLDKEKFENPDIKSECHRILTLPSSKIETKEGEYFEVSTSRQKGK